MRGARAAATFAPALWNAARAPIGHAAASDASDRASRSSRRRGHAARAQRGAGGLVAEPTAAFGVDGAHVAVLCAKRSARAKAVVAELRAAVPVRRAGIARRAAGGVQRRTGPGCVAGAAATLRRARTRIIIGDAPRVAAGSAVAARGAAFLRARARAAGSEAATAVARSARAAAAARAACSTRARIEPGSTGSASSTSAARRNPVDVSIAAAANDPDACRHRSNGGLCKQISHVSSLRVDPRAGSQLASTAPKNGSRREKYNLPLQKNHPARRRDEQVLDIAWSRFPAYDHARVGARRT
jgi:hypothetical protein